MYEPLGTTCIASAALRLRAIPADMALDMRSILVYVSSDTNMGGTHDARAVVAL
jgi:hypothetical protein